MITTRPIFRTLSVTLAATLVPVLAHAHPGHPGHDDWDWSSGLTHPATGLDHLLALLAVGLWAAQLGGRARWAVPFTFVGVMAAGALLPLAGVVLPGAALASLLLLGVLLMAAVRLPLTASATLAGLFALCHGYAHSAASASYSLGFVVSTLALLATGVAAGSLAQSAARASWLRFAGAALVAVGGFIALS